jgi:hypothetical protein
LRGSAPPLASATVVGFSAMGPVKPTEC